MPNKQHDPHFTKRAATNKESGEEDAFSGRALLWCPQLSELKTLQLSFSTVLV